jgi:hypothetical protein
MKGIREEVVRVYPFKTDYDSMHPVDLPEWIALSWTYLSAIVSPREMSKERRQNP